MSRETLSPSEAASICHVKRVAIHAAIKKGNLKAEKIKNRWQITLAALDDYRKNKYSRMRRKVNGVTIYDIEAGRWPIQFVAKWIGELLHFAVSENKIYYLVKTGVVPAYRMGKGWVILREDAEILYKKMSGQHEIEKKQMRFA